MDMRVRGRSAFLHASRCRPHRAISQRPIKSLTARGTPMSLREALSRVISEYPTAVRQTFGQNPLASYIRRDAVSALSEALGPAGRGLNIEGSAGAGNWAMIPWLAVFDPVVTDSATRGYYVVYLFHANTPTVHLSLN